MQIPVAQNLPPVNSALPQAAVTLPRFQGAEPARQVTSNRPGAYADGKSARERSSQQADEGDDSAQGETPDHSESPTAYRGLLLDLLA